jgi:hypothetical protein
MKSARVVCAVVLTLLVAGPALAAGGKKADKNTIPYFKTIDQYLKPVTLTDDQKTKLDGIKKDYEQKLKDVYAKQNVLTPEQKTAADEARKAAKAAAKDRKETEAAVDAAVKMTDEQRQQKKDAQKALRALEKEIHAKVVDLLTADQKTAIAAAKPKKAAK